MRIFYFSNKTAPAFLVCLAGFTFQTAQAQTRQAIFGSVGINDTFTPVNLSDPSAPSTLNGGDGVIHEVGSYLESGLVSQSLPVVYDAKTLHLAVDFFQDGMIPLGRFSTGTATINWTAAGWFATDSGSLTVSHGYGDATAGPNILSSQGIGTARPACDSSGKRRCRRYSDVRPGQLGRRGYFRRFASEADYIFAADGIPIH
ncbi:MAG: hypothetical protein V4726_21335 [Verrucomicrobiota bacterium]